MDLGILSLRSPLHGDLVDVTSLDFLGKIEKEGGFTFKMLKEYTSHHEDVLPVFFVQTGGSEMYFKELIGKIKSPVIILATPKNNSLAASMEIASYARQHGLTAEILFGEPFAIARRLKVIKRVYRLMYKLPGTRLGVVGAPSDWLIASTADYELLKKRFGIELIDVPIEELNAEIDNKLLIANDFTEMIREKGYDDSEVDKAIYVYSALKTIVDRHDLDGLTLRCFDLLDSYKTTGCIALSILNAEGITASCEGDIPSMLSMYILSNLSAEETFQANIASVDTKDNLAILAHCTLPLTMPESFALDTHFESGIGVGVKGTFGEWPITVFKASGDLGEYFVSEGRITKNLSESDLCRTQIEVSLKEDVSYFLRRAIANHHIVAVGNYAEYIEEFFRSLY